MNIANAKILITGAGRGIGLALARELLTRGGRVDLGMRQPDDDILQSLPNPENASIVQLDLGSRESIDTYLSRNDQHYDMLVNNAGQVTGGLLENQNVSAIYQMFQVNLVGVTHLTRALLGPMLEAGHGKIVNVSSISGVAHFPTATTYAAAKTGIVAFTNSLACELAKTGVSTLLIIPPGVRTRMFDEMEDLNSSHVDTGKIKTITPEVFAVRIADAIASDKVVLEPGGIENFISFVARHFPGTFRKLAPALSGFRR